MVACDWSGGAMEKRIKKPSLLSASLPDVSLSNYHYPHQQQQTSRNLSPLSDTPIAPSTDLASSGTHYNIDDDLWAETADRETGNVFYVAPSTTPSRHGVVPSSSSSSLSSSNPSIPDILPASPIATNVKLPRVFEESLSSSARGYHHAASSDKKFFGQSAQKKVHGMKQKKLKKKNNEATTSMSDLNQRQGKKMYTHSSHSSSDLSIPHGAQHGSTGAPLEVNTSPFVGYKIKLELDLSQLQQHSSSSGDNGGNSYSLETLGIVAARVVGKGKFRSNLTHHFSLRHEKKDQSQKFQSSLPHSSAHLPVVIKGVKAGSFVSRTSLRPGDTILAVNGHFVNMDNVDSVLATLSTCKTLEFLVKKGLSHPPHSYSSAASPSSSTALLSPPQTPSHGGLVRLVAGGRGAGGALRPRQFRRPHRHPHLLLYVTLDTKEDDPLDEDILFCYPSQEVRQNVGDMDGSTPDGGGRRRIEMEERLLKLRGVFLTLSDSLVTITEHKSHTNSAVVLDGQLFFLSFSQHGKEMLLLVLPALLVSQYQLQLLLENIEHMMILLHGSVRRALTTSNYSLSLEHLVGLMLDTLLSDETPTIGPAAPLLGVVSVPRLKLPTDVTVTLHAVLSDLEAADLGSQPVAQSVCRPYFMLGTCLLNRGALACSHLSSTRMEKVALFLHAYRLIELTASENTSQVVIWQEVFLPVDPEEKGHSESSGGCRVFLLVVGLEQMLLCMLMEEVRPPLVEHPHFTHTPSVDALYIDRGRAVLVQLKAQELLSRDFEEITSLPCLQTADSALSALSNRIASQLTRSSSHRSSPQIVKKRKALDAFSVRSFSMRKSDARFKGSESDEEGLLGSGSSSPQRSHSMLSQRRAFRQRKSSDHNIETALGGYHKEQRARHNANSLTAGLGDMLLHYVCLESGCGLMVCPTHTTPPGTVHSELLLCFQSSASRIREVLRGRASGSSSFRDDSDDEEDEEEDDDEDIDSEGSEYDVGKSIRPPASSSPFIPQKSSMIEHGVLLECCTSPNVKVRSSLQYWVIGRYFVEEDRELYVCCQESTSHNTIEMAFKLLFGWPG